MTRTIYYNYIMLGIKLKCFRRQADVICSQGYDDNREEGKDDNVKYGNSKDNMNDKDTNENNIFFNGIKKLLVRTFNFRLKKSFPPCSDLKKSFALPPAWTWKN